MRRPDAIGKHVGWAAGILALLLLAAAPARAISSKSSSFSNVVDDIDMGGQTVASASYSQQYGFGELAQTTMTDSGSAYDARAGLMPIYEFPGTITGFWASSGTTVGSVHLQWTAPGNDGYESNTKGARDFVVAYSTTASLSPASSQTAFNAALSAGGFLGSVPAPQISGTLQTMTATSLTPGVTYYFAIEAQEADGLYGNLSLGATAVATLGLSEITDLTASSTTVVGQIDLSWTAPYYTGTNPPVSYVAVYSTSEMNTQSDFQTVDSTSFSIGNALPGGSRQTFQLSGLAACTQYFVAIVGKDSGTPPAQAPWYRNAVSSTPYVNYYNYATTAGCTRVPDVPVNVALTTGAASNTLAWSAVTMLNDGTLFTSTGTPPAQDLEGYDVQLSTWPDAPDGDWTDLTAGCDPTSPSNCVAVSTNPYKVDNSTWVAACQTQACYYRVFAVNTAGFSLPSNERSTATDDLWSVFVETTPVFESAMMDVPATYAASTLANFYVYAAPQYQDISSNSPVVTSVDFEALLGGVTLDPTTRLAGAANLTMTYSIDSSGNVQIASLRPALAPATAQDLSLFWWNGNGWIQAYGKVQTLSDSISVQTPFLGKYQLRLAQVPGGFAFDPSGLSNKFITPNGDGKNDNAVFNFANPQFSSVSGKIFDLQGRYIADMSAPSGGCAGGPGQCLMWDGRGSNGTIVSGGVYVYQLSGGGTHYNGTIVVIK